MRYFLQYWIINLAFAVLLFWAYYFGVVDAILKFDVTRITVLTLAVYAVASTWIGYLTKIVDSTNFVEVDHNSELGWFASDLCLTLGLLGTVIGFIMMMTAELGAVNVNDPASMVVLITHLMKSMGTALYTTAVGIICGMVLKIQCFNLQHAVGRLKNNDW